MTAFRDTAVDITAGTLTLIQSPHVSIARCAAQSGQRFYIENALEHLTTPGQFYFDHVTSEVSYLPLPGERITDFVAYVT